MTRPAAPPALGPGHGGGRRGAAVADPLQCQCAGGQGGVRTPAGTSVRYHWDPCRLTTVTVHRRSLASSKSRPSHSLSQEASH